MDFWNMIGINNTANIYEETFGSSSNVILTDNPVYTVDKFSMTFPIFEIGDELGKIPYSVVNMFISMAHASIKFDRYKTSWEYFMGLYIAHFCTLYLQTQSGNIGAQGAIQSAMPKGIQTSKSVDGLSVSYDFMDMQSDLKGYGTFKITSYGQQLATLTKMYGLGGMWIR
jgi:hypothetical protein